MSKRKADSSEGGDVMTSTAAKTNATEQEVSGVVFHQ